MPISNADLQELAEVSLGEYLRNIPVDQIDTERPLLKKIMSGRNTTDAASFPWRRAEGSFHLDYDLLFSNGIKVRQGERGALKLEQNEKVQLVNLLDEQMEFFQKDFMRKLDLELHRSGTHAVGAVSGLDALVSVTPNIGVIGGLDGASAISWRNHVQTGIVTSTTGNLFQAMESNWHKCIKNGSGPDFILAGSDFIDAYREEITCNAKTLDASYGVNTGLSFKGEEIIWDPQFEELDAFETSRVPWEKRCYFLNTKHLTLHYDLDIDKRGDWQGSEVVVNLRLAMNHRNAHAVLSIA